MVRVHCGVLSRPTSMIFWLTLYWLANLVLVRPLAWFCMTARLCWKPSQLSNPRNIVTYHSHYPVAGRVVTFFAETLRCSVLLRARKARPGDTMILERV